MTHQKINQIEESKIVDHTLSIQVSLNGLSFCTQNTKGEIKSVFHENFDIKNTPEQLLEKVKYHFEHHNDLQQKFESLEVIHQSELYTFVPEVLFDKNHLKEYLQYNIKVLENDFLTFDALDQHEMNTVYVPFANINNFFFDVFGSFTYKHAATILLESLMLQQKNSEDCTIFANIHSMSFDLIILNRGSFLLGNTYPYHNKEDFLYYLMFAVEQLKLNPEEFKLVLLGDIKKDHPCVLLAQTYIRNVGFGERGNTAFTQNPNLNKIENHEHFVLLSPF